MATAESATKSAEGRGVLAVRRAKEGNAADGAGASRAHGSTHGCPGGGLDKLSHAGAPSSVLRQDDNEVLRSLWDEKPPGCNRAMVKSTRQGAARHYRGAVGRAAVDASHQDLKGCGVSFDRGCDRAAPHTVAVPCASTARSARRLEFAGLRSIYSGLRIRRHRFIEAAIALRPGRGTKPGIGRANGSPERAWDDGWNSIGRNSHWPASCARLTGARRRSGGVPEA
jgi:hypothetical protein